jgi:hypothetical protein
MNAKKIYCNGCSHSAGGGLENQHILRNGMSIVEYYNSKYNISWENINDVLYSSVLSHKLNAESVNEATSGGGSERVIRMAYDFVKSNYKIKDEILLILELPSLGRLDLYSNKLNDYIIGNLHFTNNDYSDNSISGLYGTRGYYSEEFANDNLKIHSALKSYYDNFFSKKSYYLNLSRQINTFFGYLKHNKIKYIFFGGELLNGIEDEFRKNNSLKLKVLNRTIEDFHQYAVEMKSTITEECDFLIDDLHPGYFAHKNFGNLLYDYIIEHYHNL